MNKVIRILKRDGLVFTIKRAVAWLIGHSPFWDKLSFKFYKNYRLTFAPSMLTYVLFAQKTARDEDTKVLERFLSAGDIVIDVGAHIGSTAIVSADKVGKDGKVLAFEASKKFYKILTTNVDINRLSSIVTCFPFAVGDKKTKVFINESVADDTTNYVGETGNSVEQIILDDYTKDLHEVNFLKIDVEGYEPAVLSGATETLQKTKYVYIEFCTDNFKNLGSDPNEIIDVLTDIFTLHTLIDDKLNPFEYKNNEKYATNILAIKK
ncbi:MAG: FkbM family methyltransferase [Candidatus Nomurabacteria bacterium]|nr:FkbM family methyltransferase [Candidatus Nomurabacteria bacterium]USN88126.1 MAG: FkbM family methyltransferase [Candidatus Nomurabacteria bacterium]